jgi:hypothetical protein
MTKIDISKFAVIPFFDHAELPGRFVCSTIFYDGEWHAWIDANGQFFKTQMWPAEAVYFGKRGERKKTSPFAF